MVSNMNCRELLLKKEKQRKAEEAELEKAREKARIAEEKRKEREREQKKMEDKRANAGKYNRL